MCQSHSHSHQFNIHNLVNRAFGNRIKLCSRLLFQWGKNGNLKTAPVTRKSLFKGTTNVLLLLDLCISIHRHSIWFVVGIRWQMIYQCSESYSIFASLFFSRHQLSPAVRVTYDIANVNLSVYYAIFNHKFDGIYHVFFLLFLLTAMIFHAKWQYNLLFDFKIMHVFEFINPSQGFPVQRQMSAIFMSKSSKIKIQKQLCSNCHVAVSK